nr:reverse transcriptase [Tanacetum cinerariifolium]
KIQGVVFEADVMLLPLGGQKVVLRGTHQSELAWLTGKKMSKLVSHNGTDQVSSMCCVNQSATLNLMHYNDDQDSLVYSKLHQLLEEYSDLFSMPKEFPQRRSFDHKIPLKTYNAFINIKTYRYPPTPKDTIDAMIKELLDSRVIRPSNSPFSSFINMVKKKDGSWRICIDYRHLNKYTIKDKFPIPIIEELIDELYDQRITTLFQSKWLPKLLGIDYNIECKKGKDNAAIDGLFRIERQEGLKVGTFHNSKYVWHNDQLRRKDK